MNPKIILNKKIFKTNCKQHYNLFFSSKLPIFHRRKSLKNLEYIRYTIKIGGIFLKVTYNEIDKLLTLQITEEIDHHYAEKIRTRADFEIQKYIPKKLVIDFAKVSFMDSAGIGMILGRYKLITMFGGTMSMKNVSPTVKKVFEMSGVTKIIPIIEEQGGTKIGKCV